MIRTIDKISDIVFCAGTGNGFSEDVVSLEKNVKVNCKLTDFGASRNINMLNTNMTFTKGVGTPVYMSPEILNKQKLIKKMKTQKI